MSNVIPESIAEQIIAEKTYSHLYLCDTETKVFQDKATLCYGNEELELASLTNLNSFIENYI